MIESNVDLIVPSSYIEKWQAIVDTAAQLIEVPSGLIMRLVDDDISVFVSSATEGNPYELGEKLKFENSGLYCETVIKTNQQLHVPNALKDKHWDSNPDIELNMISYLGLPILKPDETPFGTICVLDCKENHYNNMFIQLMKNFREIIENDLKTVYMNQVLGLENKQLNDFINEYQQLKGLLRICGNCRKIRDEDDNWIDIETYIRTHSDVDFSHSLCESCVSELYKDEDWYKKKQRKI